MKHRLEVYSEPFHKEQVYLCYRCGLKTINNKEIYEKKECLPNKQSKRFKTYEKQGRLVARNYTNYKTQNE